MVYAQVGSASVRTLTCVSKERNHEKAHCHLCGPYRPRPVHRGNSSSGSSPRIQHAFWLERCAIWNQYAQLLRLSRVWKWIWLRFPVLPAQGLVPRHESLSLPSVVGLSSPELQPTRWTLLSQNRSLALLIPRSTACFYCDHVSVPSHRCCRWLVFLVGSSGCVVRQRLDRVPTRDR